MTREALEWGGATKSADVQISITSCCACGIVFGIERVRFGHLQDHGDTFYCPNGHRLHYGKSRMQQLEDQLSAERKALAAERQMHGYTEHERQVIKGRLTRLSNRVAFGVCPCCHRHFDNVQRHMATMHPDFLKKQSGVGNPLGIADGSANVPDLRQETMSVHEVAAFRGVNPMTVYLAIRARRLPAVQVKGCFRIARKAAEQWYVRGRGRVG